MDRNNQKEFILNLIKKTVNKPLTKESIELINEFFDRMLKIKSVDELTPDTESYIFTYLLMLAGIRFSNDIDNLKISEAISHIAIIAVNKYFNNIDIDNKSDCECEDCDDCEREVEKAVSRASIEYKNNSPITRPTVTSKEDCNVILKDFKENGRVYKRYLPEMCNNGFRLPQKGETMLLNIEDYTPSGARYRGRVVIDDEGYVIEIIEEPVATFSADLNFEDIYDSVISDVLKYRAE